MFKRKKKTYSPEIVLETSKIRIVKNKEAIVLEIKSNDALGAITYNKVYETTTTAAGYRPYSGYTVELLQAIVEESI